MGAVGPGVVAATFFNFNPALVARSVPGVWASAAPADVVNARLRAADSALRRLLGDQVSSAAVTESAELARRPARAPRARTARSTPPTPTCPGPTSRTSCSGTR